MPSKLVSLLNWPEQPARFPMELRLSPLSKKILKKANVNLKSILPISYEVFLQGQEYYSKQDLSGHYQLDKKRRKQKVNILREMRQKEGKFRLKTNSSKSHSNLSSSSTVRKSSRSADLLSPLKKETMLFQSGRFHKKNQLKSNKKYEQDYYGYGIKPIKSPKGKIQSKKVKSKEQQIKINNLKSQPKFEKRQKVATQRKLPNWTPIKKKDAKTSMQKQNIRNMILSMQKMQKLGEKQCRELSHSYTWRISDKNNVEMSQAYGQVIKSKKKLKL